MTLLDHPIWQYVQPYAHVTEGRDNVDFLHLPDQLRELALGVVCNCVSCGRMINVMRARQKSDRSRIVGTGVEHRLFYAPTCPTEVDAGCSRTRVAKAHKEFVLVLLGYAPLPVQIDTMDALALKEPWLELILLGIKTLETRTKCLRKSAGDVVLTSSQTIDEAHWDDPFVGGRLDSAAKQRAMDGLGKTRGLVTMSGFRPGEPGKDDAAALIAIALPNGVRQVSEVSNVRRLIERPVVRVQERDGKILLVSGSSQGFFRVPANEIKVAA